METKEAIVLPERCDQCSNNCKADELICGRGKAYFERLKRGEKEYRSDDPLVRLFGMLGEISRHKSEMIHTHGGNEREMFSPALTPEEQETLLAFLEKLDKQWEAEHAARHRKPQ